MFRRNVTTGVLLPALRAHARRRPRREVGRVIDSLERRLLAQVCAGKEGLPLRWWVRDGMVTSAAHSVGRAEAFMLLEALSVRGLRRVLQRSIVQRALEGVPAEDDPDLATSFSIAARCDWLLR